MAKKRIPFSGIFKTKDGEHFDIASDSFISRDEIKTNRTPIYSQFIDKDGAEHNILDFLGDGKIQALINAHNTSNISHADIRNIMNNLVGVPVYDDQTHSITFTAVNGAELTIDLPLEGLATSMAYDPATREIILTSLDGSTIRVNVSDLIREYTGFTGANIQIVIDPGNVIRATLLAGTIGDTQLTPELLERINNGDSWNKEGVIYIPEETATNGNRSNGQLTDSLPYLFNWLRRRINWLLSDDAVVNSANKITYRPMTDDLHNWLPTNVAGQFFGEGASITNAPTSGWWRYIGMSHNNTDGYCTILAFSFYHEGDIRVLTKAGEAWSPWKIMYASNTPITLADNAGNGTLNTATPKTILAQMQNHRDNLKWVFENAPINTSAFGGDLNTLSRTYYGGFSSGVQNKPPNMIDGYIFSIPYDERRWICQVAFGGNKDIGEMAFRTSLNDPGTLWSDWVNVANTKFVKDSISDIQVGGRNLLKNSFLQRTSSDYKIAILDLADSNLKDGEQLTISIKGQLGADRERWGIYNSGGYVGLAFLYPSDRNSNGIYTKTFDWLIGTAANTHLEIYQQQNDGQSASTIEWVNLERGNVATDWTPAPEDMVDTYTEQTITGKKTFTEELVVAKRPSGNNKGQIRIKGSEGSSGYGVVFRHDFNGFYMLVTDNNDADGAYNSFRPFSFNLASGDVNFGSKVSVQAQIPIDDNSSRVATTSFVKSNIPYDKIIDLRSGSSTPWGAELMYFDIVNGSDSGQGITIEIDWISAFWGSQSKGSVKLVTTFAFSGVGSTAQVMGGAYRFGGSNGGFRYKLVGNRCYIYALRPAGNSLAGKCSIKTYNYNAQNITYTGTILQNDPGETLGYTYLTLPTGGTDKQYIRGNGSLGNVGDLGSSKTPKIKFNNTDFNEFMNGFTNPISFGAFGPIFNYGPTHISQGRSGEETFKGGVYTPNGKVVLIPYNFTNIGIYDPISNTYIDGPTHDGGGKAFNGGVLAHGSVVMVPAHSPHIGMYHWMDGYYEGNWSTHGTPSNLEAFSGGVLAPIGKLGEVVFAPYDADHVGIFNVSENRYIKGPAHGFGLGGGQYSGAVLAPNGLVIFVPHKADHVGIYNPITNTFSKGAKIPITAIGGAFKGGVLTKDGKIVFVPYNSINIGIYDPVIDTYTNGMNHGLYERACQGGVLLPDGNILFASCASYKLAIYNPTEDSFTNDEIGVDGGNSMYNGAVLIPDGKVILVPHDNYEIGIVDFMGLTIGSGYCLHPYLNKF